MNLGFGTKIQRLILVLGTLLAPIVFSQIPPSSQVVQADFSGIHPMIQTSTSDTQVQINMLAPRLKEYTFTATPVAGGAAVEGKIVATLKDPDQKLHEKVLQVQFQGLQPDTEYELVVNEIFRGSHNFADRRRFKTIGKSTGPLKMLSVSCMNDENRYRPYRNHVWSNGLNQKPDVILLIGDQTYVDSFDYVERNKATTLDVWMRHFRSFDQNPLTRAFHLVPTYSTWDDHDTGINDGNATTPTIGEALKAFEALYGNAAIPGFVERGSGGTYSLVHMKGQNLFLLDARTFRRPFTENTRYAHFGKDQEDWFFQKLANVQGPVHIFKGDMWATPTVMDHDKRITESFFGDHPGNFKPFMERLFASGKPVAFYSGDIHFSEVLEYGPKHAGTSFSGPYTTYEITSSPVHSIIFFPKPGEEMMWPNPHRVAGYKDYNTVTIVSTAVNDNQFSLNVLATGAGAHPLFQIEKIVNCENALKQP